jgi:hypothetical protein
MAECDPRDRTTYKFYSNEKGYYDQYSDSYFGFTMKKGGWDCCRHYEIIAAGCLPYFQGIERCPVRTLTWMPKDILLEARALADAATFHEPTWLGLMARIQDALRGHLTTEACAQRILEQLDD